MPYTRMSIPLRYITTGGLEVNMRKTTAIILTFLFIEPFCSCVSQQQERSQVNTANKTIKRYPQSVLVITDHKIDNSGSIIDKISGECDFKKEINKKTSDFNYIIQCNSYSMNFNPRYVPDDKINSFLMYLRADMDIAMKFSKQEINPDHEVFSIIDRVQQVTYIWLQNGYDQKGIVKSTIRKFASEVNGHIYSNSSVYTSDGKKILGWKRASDIFE